MLDSVCKLSPTTYTNKLSLKDTVLNLTTLIDGQTFYKTIPLDIIFPTKYYIKSGETLLGISKRLGVSFDLIKSLNNIQNDNDIKVEQILLLK
jgi:LysM repeat protein